MKGLCILGSTGSVGVNALAVARKLAGQFRVVSLTAGRNIELLAAQVAEFHPEMVAVAEPGAIRPLTERLQSLGHGAPLHIAAGGAGRLQAATLASVDFVLSASHGVSGLAATYEAIRAGKQIGLANKEALVAAGELVMRAARERGIELLPVDSEHSAVHQCLRCGRLPEVRRLILTGSGGPFLETPQTEFATITPQQALKHPVWRMGDRITIDSATLMNKALEVIEAHWLFGLGSSQIDLVIHPESVIHSMVEFQDGSVVAQLAVADMRIPIQYAMTYPERMPSVDGRSLSLDFNSLGRLSFLRPDPKRFPCLELGRSALAAGGSAPCVLNAADEVAVAAFISRRLGFENIPRVIERVMARATPARLESLDDVAACDHEARARAEEEIARLGQ